MKIGVVIVTYNRLSKLKIALEKFDLQTKKPEFILAVDNASNDGTGDYLRLWEKEAYASKRIVVQSSINSGGSGGFYLGLYEAMKLNCEWIWLSDDDAFPENNCLEIADDFLASHADENISAICGSVINKGEYDLSHRKNYIVKGLNIIEERIPATEYKKDWFSLTTFSYVGAIINKSKLNEVGLTIKDYFLWCDDTEHSLRLSKVGKIYCIPSIRVNHDVGFSNDGLTWKTYYGYRNLTDMYKRHFGFMQYNWFCLKMYIKTILNDFKHHNNQEGIVIRQAISDARKGKTGIHNIYKPGWKKS